MSNLTSLLLPPTPSEGEWWVLQWNLYGHAYFAAITLYKEGGNSVNGGGTSIAGIAFEYGTISTVGGSSNYQATSQTNGTLTETAPGRITITVPASGVGLPSLGSPLSGLRATTFAVVGTSLLPALLPVNRCGTS